MLRIRSELLQEKIEMCLKEKKIKEENWRKEEALKKLETKVEEVKE